MPIPVINAQVTTNERLAKLEALVAQLDKCLDNLEQGQCWIIGLPVHHFDRHYERVHYHFDHNALASEK